MTEIASDEQNVDYVVVVPHARVVYILGYILVRVRVREILGELGIDVLCLFLVVHLAQIVVDGDKSRRQRNRYDKKNNSYCYNNLFLRLFSVMVMMVMRLTHCYLSNRLLDFVVNYYNTPYFCVFQLNF